MSVTVTFDTTENCAKFALTVNLTAEADSFSIDIPWEKLSIAKSNSNAIGFTQLSEKTEEFIIRGDLSNDTLSALLNVKEDLGEGFYLIETANGLKVNDLVDSMDPVVLSHVGLQNVSSLTNVAADHVEIDPASDEAQWARIRLASRYRPVKQSFEYHDVLTTKNASEVYVIDSGINHEHPEFTEVSVQDFWKIPSFKDFTDKQGHGTRVASCIAGKNLGVTKNVKLFSVKIIEPGFMPTLIDLGKALDAILKEAVSNSNITRIVNVSWFVDENAWLESKFQSLLNAGVTVVAAAGNTGVDIANTTPAGISGVITVGSIDKYDIPSGFNNIAPSDSGLVTNYGLMLDIFAPGENVVVATQDGHYTINSGTSLSAGYVTGVAAHLASLFDNFIPNPLLLEKVMDSSTKDALLFDSENFNEKQNNLAYLVGVKDTAMYLLDLYIGSFTSTVEELTLNLQTVLDTSEFTSLKPNEKFIWELEFADAADEKIYSDFFQIDQENDILLLNKPSINIPNNEHIKMVRFKINSVSDTVKLPSPWIFFFHVDPAIDDEIAEFDITRALSETDSTSIFLSTFLIK